MQPEMMTLVGICHSRRLYFLLDSGMRRMLTLPQLACVGATAPRASGSEHVPVLPLGELIVVRKAYREFMRSPKTF